MSDHNERACQRCGSLLHHESDHTARTPFDDGLDKAVRGLLTKIVEARWLLTHLPDSHQFKPEPDWWQRREAWLKGGGQP